MVRSLLLLIAVMVSLTVSVLSHTDERKLRDHMPPYEGPGYRAASALSGGVGYGVQSDGGFASQGIRLMSWLPLAEFPGDPVSGNDCWGYTAPSGREYAIICLSTGTAFVEVTDPGDARLVDFVDGPDNNWRDVKVYSHYAYMVSEGGSGIQVADLSQIDSGVVSFVGNVLDGGIETTHNVAIDETSGFLYRCGGGDSGLRIYDVSQPASPSFVGQWSDRYVHDAQIVTYESGPYSGRQIAFCCGGFNGGFTDTGLDIVDVTDKAAPFSLAHLSYSDRAYSHQAWLSEDRQLLYLNDELDEDGVLTTRTIVIDVSDLSQPIEVSEFTNGLASISHNLYVRGNRIFEANYTSGLRVFDATNPLAPVEIAFFDTFPADDAARFRGLWSTYPFFESGTVLGSDKQRGLFVWWEGDPLLRVLFDDRAPEALSPLGGKVPFRIAEKSPGDLDPGSVRFYLDRGQGFEEVSVEALSSNRFVAHLPALPCGQEIPYYVSARSLNGMTWNDPPTAPMRFHRGLAADVVTEIFVDDVELDRGWTLGAPGDDASMGHWVRANPFPTPSQPDGDHSEPGTLCFLTGDDLSDRDDDQNDVDDGKTTLLSPVFDMRGLSDPRLTYWHWFSNGQGKAPFEDVLKVEITGDGVQWVEMDTVGPDEDESSGGWVRNSFRLQDFIALTATVQWRFVASDLGADSLVDAAIDDVRLIDMRCSKEITRPKSLR